MKTSTSLFVLMTALSSREHDSISDDGSPVGRFCVPIEPVW
ncbi:hypothetical protein [Fibrisoma montanum]|nr:hypothetical protein [Fibrisoma montanum]